MKIINIGIIGATGSIGKRAIDLICKFPDKFKVNFLAAYSNYDLLATLAKQVNAENIVILDSQKYPLLKEKCIALGLVDINLFHTKDALLELIKPPNQVILIANNGIEALDYILESIYHNQTIVLANKEALVSAGTLIKNYLKNSNAKIIPADSEHNAIYQLLGDTFSSSHIEEIIITASGGPFYQWKVKDLQNITKKEALIHPTWSMGEFITINSATLVNKALEIIEAHYLFNIDYNKINAVYHPQSLIHGIVKFVDGSLNLVAYKPNMIVALAYAFTLKERLTLKELSISPLMLNNIIIEEISIDKIKPIQLSKDVIKRGGNAPCIFNVANEVAVNAFLLGKINFLSIINIIEYCLNKISYNNINTISDVYKEALLAKNTALEYINNIS